MFFTHEFYFLSTERLFETIIPFIPFIVLSRMLVKAISILNLKIHVVLNSGHFIIANENYLLLQTIWRFCQTIFETQESLYVSDSFYRLATRVWI